MIPCGIPSGSAERREGGCHHSASGSPGLLVLPAYIGGDSMANLVNACIGTVIAMVVSFVVCYVLYGVWKKQGKLEEGE